jgi:hypothetical protein
MAGLVPAIHALLVASKTWMPGPRPGMTAGRLHRRWDKKFPRYQLVIARLDRATQ